MSETFTTAAPVRAARRHILSTALAAAALAWPAAASAHDAAARNRAPVEAANGTLENAAHGSSVEALAVRGMMPLFEQHSRRGGSSDGGGQAVPRGGSAAPSGGSSGGSDSGRAAGRSGADSGSTPAPAPRSGTRTRDRSGDSNRDGGSTPTYSRPRGDRPATGTAVPRRPGDNGHNGGGDVIIVNPGWYPWGWGGLGFGGYYGYYDPWGWYDSYPPAVYGDDDYDGALKIKVKPREAEVYVDGYFAGEVDDYDGVFQKLHLEPGPHRIEIRMEGYEPLMFEVRIQPDRTVTYKGELQKLETAD